MICMGKYEVCWLMGRVPTGMAPHQLTESPFKYLKCFTRIHFVFFYLMVTFRAPKVQLRW